MDEVRIDPKEFLKKYQLNHAHALMALLYHFDGVRDFPKTVILKPGDHNTLEIANSWIKRRLTLTGAIDWATCADMLDQYYNHEEFLDFDDLMVRWIQETD